MDEMCLDPQDKLPPQPPHPSDMLSTKHSPPPTGQRSACGPPPPPEDNFWNSPNTVTKLKRQDAHLDVSLCTTLSYLFSHGLLKNLMQKEWSVPSSSFCTVNHQCHIAKASLISLTNDWMVQWPGRKPWSVPSFCIKLFGLSLCKLGFKWS